MEHFDPEKHHPKLFRMIDKDTYRDYANVCAKKSISVSGSLTALMNRYMKEVVRIIK